jgi:hypothetical protein
MSGPLATWVAEHSKADAHGRAVLVQLALAAKHDGTPVLPPTWDDLARRTALHRGTVAKRLAELRQLGEILAEDGGGGRGRATRYHIVVTLCGPDSGCWSCNILTEQQLKPSPRATLSGLEAPVIVTRKGSRSARKGSRSGPKPSPTATHNGTGDGTPPQGGTVTHPESARSRQQQRPADAAAAGAQASEEPPATPFNPRLPWLTQIRRFDPAVELVTGASPGPFYRLSREWERRSGVGVLPTEVDAVAKWLAWAAEEMRVEEERKRAASRARLAKTDQEQGSAS